MWNQAWNVADNDGFAEDNATENIADRSIRRLPHTLEIKFFYASLIWGNRCALHADAMLLDCVSAIDCHLIVSGVTMFDAKVVVLEIDIEVRQNQLIFDELLDNSGHLIAV